VGNVPILLAKGAYVPEQGYDTMDLSMPQYRVEALDDLKTTTTPDAAVFSVERASAPSAASSGPSRAEQGALAVAQAKAKKAAAKAEALAKQEALKQRRVVQE
jgi:hypothetical protein